MDLQKIQCKICKKTPDKISEYRSRAKEENLSPDDYVVQEEGTYNPATGKFYCTDCYCKIGMPLGKA